MDSLKRIAKKVDQPRFCCGLIILGIVLLAVYFQTGFDNERWIEVNEEGCVDNEFVWGSLYALAGVLTLALLYRPGKKALGQS